jgi:hypothetical protein
MVDNLNIGQIAGDIWKYLEEFNETTSFQLKVALAVNNSKLFLALGWLLREEKIVIEPLDKGYKVKKV